MERMAQSPLLEATCSHIRLALSHLAWEEAGIRGVEFWTQRRAVDAPMHCHWDIDEALGASSGRVRCPWLSVLVYLSCAGGPTLVLDQQPVQSTRGMRGRRAARLVWPHEGKVHAFGGDLLHGVLAPWSESGATPVGRLRHTLILNFWRRRPQQVPTLPRVLCPLVFEAARAHSGAVTAHDYSVAALPRASGATAREPGRHLPAEAHKSWEPSETAHWTRQRLLLGMFDRHEHLHLMLPQITYRGYSVEDFETIIFTDTECTSRISPGRGKA